MSTAEQVYASLKPPRPSEDVHRTECTRCFDDQDGADGIDVCLHCFNGSCPSTSVNQHSLLHHRQTGHSAVLNVKRVKKRRNSNEPPLKKLAIREEPDEAEKYDFVLTPRFFANEACTDVQPSKKSDELAAGVMSSVSSAQKSDVRAWEEEIVPCQHTLGLVQPEKKNIDAQGLAACAFEGCGLTSNLWLCLACGSLGCGRKQFGGGGGNGHALEHTKQTGHPVAVKLGTIEPEGTADIYCYACDDARLDPNLQKHLANFGINVANQTKTEKSMTELNLEQNLKFDFSMTGADGKDLQPVFGEGLTGLKNLGNSCYMASTLQSLFSLEAFQDRYLTAFFTHVQVCQRPDPANCFECQMAKMGNGLLSGRYSVPRKPEQNEQEEAKVVFQEGLRPTMFKALVGKNHPEFSTMRQQDASEFHQHLLSLVTKSSKAEGESDPGDIFRFATEERLQCSECKGVQYKQVEEESLSFPVPVTETIPTTGSAEEGAKEQRTPIEISKCLDAFASDQAVEDWNCPACSKSVTAIKTTKFATLPNVLAVVAGRYQLVNWVPTKFEVPLIVPSEGLQLDKYLGHGLQPGETELPKGDEAEQAAASIPAVDASAMAQLVGMGFPEVRAQKALLATGNTSDAEVAMNWLFQYMEDPDIDEPIKPSSVPSSTKNSGPSDEAIANVVAMGFSDAQARKALIETNGNLEQAIEWIFSNPDDPGLSAAEAEAKLSASAASGSSSGGIKGSRAVPATYSLKAFVSHRGPSVHTGHYVAHVLKERGPATQVNNGQPTWVLYNDEKVVKAEDSGSQSAEELRKFAYVYIFQRTSQP